MTESKEKYSYKCTIGMTLVSELTTLIDFYKVRLAKIERSANRIKDRTEEKVWKESAAEQTKIFINKLWRLQKQSIIYMELCDGDCSELISENDIQSQEESK